MQKNAEEHLETIEDLERSIAEAEKLTETLRLALHDKKEQQRKENLQIVADFMKERGVTVHEIALFLGVRLSTQTRATAESKPKLPPKYRNPQNHSETWTGKGRNEPRWIAGEQTNPGKKPREYPSKYLIGQPE